MPKTKLRKNSGEPGTQIDAVEEVPEDGAASKLVKCCSPRGCQFSDRTIDESEPCNSVKVVCNNEECDQSSWMHHECFIEWEEHVLVYLRTCGRARSWNEKQRIQNLWTKKGYDLAYKACDCLCGKGHLKKDLDFIPSTSKDETEETKKSKHHRKNDKPLPVTSARSQPIPVLSSSVVRPKGPARTRSTSFSSTGSSPPSSMSPEFSPNSLKHVDKYQDSKFEFSLTSEQAAAGNIFYHRPDLRAFNKLPAHKRNPYHIKMEDEGPYGNDETRCFVLATLSIRRVTCIPCVVCGHDLKIFDRYPLVDGTLFLSPQRYISDISLQFNGQNQYMNAVCMMCAEGLYRELKCKHCYKTWNGSALQIGTMYSYDVFAASPCCLRRLQCKNCGQLAVEQRQAMPFFSQFSRAHTCVKCKATGYHFVKPLNEIFFINRH